jgi:hypothetical protein
MSMASTGRLDVTYEDTPTADDVTYATLILTGKRAYPSADTPLGQEKRLQLQRVIGYIQRHADCVR